MVKVRYITSSTRGRKDIKDMAIDGDPSLKLNGHALTTMSVSLLGGMPRCHTETDNVAACELATSVDGAELPVHNIVTLCSK